MKNINKTFNIIIASKLVEYNSKSFTNFINSIDNPTRITELFNKDTDLMSQDEKLKAKELFSTAQKNKSVMWQDIFSFDNKGLEKQGLYNPKTKELDEKKIKDAVRKSIEFAIEKRCIDQTCIWIGAIHFNTNNIHVHVTICEPKSIIQQEKHNQKTLDIMKSKLTDELFFRI